MEQNAAMPASATGAPEEPEAAVPEASEPVSGAVETPADANGGNADVLADGDEASAANGDAKIENAEEFDAVSSTTCSALKHETPQKTLF